LIGTLHIEGDLWLGGIVEGGVDATGDVEIGDEAKVNASIAGRDVSIHGHVSGPVTARKRLVVAKSASLIGDVRVARLVIQDGASFSGNVSMGPASAPAPKVPEAAAPRLPEPPAPSAQDGGNASTGGMARPVDGNLKVGEVSVEPEQVKAKLPEVKAKAPEVKAQAPAAKAEAQEVKSKPTEVKAKAPEVTAKAPELKAKAPELKAKPPQGKGKAKR
jgi:cytoskeletal protein CcmA (bactofilin family)